MFEDKVILCGASRYEQLFYFNPDFDSLPKEVKQELQILCVLFTEEVGGVFTICFDENGEVLLQTESYEEDLLYDEISSGLLINEIQRKRQELFQSLQMFYKVFVKGETPEI